MWRHGPLEAQRVPQVSRLPPGDGHELAPPQADGVAVINCRRHRFDESQVDDVAPADADRGAAQASLVRARAAARRSGRMGFRR